MAYVLVVEDDKDAADALCAYLRGSRHLAESAPNGREALLSILTRTPDVVVLDLFMPGMDGRSLLAVLRSYLRLQSLPVVVLTGLPPDDAMAETLKVNTILIKGRASLQDVLQAVERELEDHKKVTD